MQCTATLSSGQRCRRECQNGLPVCSYHRRKDERHQARGFYTQRLFPEERQALAESDELEGIDAEIQVLRVLIRRVVDAADIEAARRAIATLVDALRARQKLVAAHGQMESTLDRVLDSLSKEFGVDL